MRIYFFDFDCTITNKDSFIRFLFYTKGFFLGLLIFSIILPYYIFYRILKKDTEFLKEKLIYIIFKNIDVKDFNNLCYDYSKKDFPLIIKKSFIDCIKKISL